VVRTGARSLRGDLALLTCAAGWGLTFPLIRSAVEHDVSPLLFVGLRFALATAVLLPVALVRRVRLSAAALRDGALVGLFLFAGFATQTLGLQTVSPARSAFLTSFYVLFTPLLAVIVTRMRPPAAVLGGLTLAFVGGFVFTGAGGASAGGITRGDLWSIGCALAFAAQMVALSVVVRRHGVLLLTLLQSLVTATAAFALLPLAETPVWNPTPGALWSLAFNGIVGSALLLGLQAWGQRTTPAPRAAVLFASEPVWAALFSFLFWGHTIAPREMAGGGLIVLGILTAELSPGRRRVERVDRRPREGYDPCPPGPPEDGAGGQDAPGEAHDRGA
jgi:drug/metabolite transporter (DMT)-like permease